MNLELIKKYEKEFLHMLHGGKVLMGKKDPVTNTIKWYPSVLNPFVETSESILIVINDIYCTYRTALAEGKIVQYKMGIIANSNEPKWHDLTPKEFNSYKVKDFWDEGLGNIKGVGNYRIKPEEPKFKVGDFVRYIHAYSPKPLRIINIHYEKYYFENAEIILRVDEIEKWEPKEGEICIFWDSVDTGAVISKFSHMEQEKYGTDLYTWNNCMPFTGTLPPHMKDSK